MVAPEPITIEEEPSAATIDTIKAAVVKKTMRETKTDIITGTSK